MSNSLWPHGLYSPWNSPGQNTGVGSLSLLQGIFPNPGVELRSPTWLVDSLLAEPQGKPSNTGVGNLSLLQQIFLTQELNQGFLHCTQILCQLSYQGSPFSRTLWCPYRVLHSGCISLQSHQQCRRVPFSPHYSTVIVFCDDGHFDRCEVMSYCSFDLQFS